MMEDLCTLAYTLLLALGRNVSALMRLEQRWDLNTQLNMNLKETHGKTATNSSDTRRNMVPAISVKEAGGKKQSEKEEYNWQIAQRDHTETP